MSRILIIGGTGVLGRALSDGLADSLCRVDICSRFPPQSELKSASHWFKLDLLSATADLVLGLSAQGNPRYDWLIISLRPATGQDWKQDLVEQNLGAVLKWVKTQNPEVRILNIGSIAELNTRRSSSYAEAKKNVTDLVSREGSRATTLYCGIVREGNSRFPEQKRIVLQWSKLFPEILDRVILNVAPLAALVAVIRGYLHSSFFGSAIAPKIVLRGNYIALGDFLDAPRRLENKNRPPPGRFRRGMMKLASGLLRITPGLSAETRRIQSFLDITLSSYRNATDSINHYRVEKHGVPILDLQGNITFIRLNVSPPLEGKTCI